MRTAWLRTSVSRFSSKLVHLSVSLIGHSRTVVALVDSGATLNFINESIVTTLGLEPERCTPTQVLLADGRVLAHSNRQVTLKTSIAGIPQTQTFLIAPIGVHSIILGMPWLEYTNPTIDWRNKTVHLTSNASPPQPLEKRPEILPPKLEAPPFRRVKKKKTQNPLKSPPPRSPPRVRLTTKVNSNDQLYVLHLDEIISFPEYLSAAQEASISNPPPIPEEYADLAEVFSKKKAHELPPTRGPLDHHIHLEKDSKPVFGPIYNLSEMELQVLKEYIEENLPKGFIRRGCRWV